MTYWCYETFAPERHKQARDCLEQAVQLDPDYSLAWSRLAFMYIEEQKYGYNVRPRSLDRALEAAEKAIALNPQNQDAFYALAIIRYMTEADFASFRTLSERAIAMNPNDAWILGEIGTWTAYSGE
jgi:Tfp pilus assembly protein PilF